MNNEQLDIYNSFLRRIDSTIEQTVSNVANSPLPKLRDTLWSNVEIWKNIQNDLGKSSLPNEVIIKLSLLCDDAFRKYEKKFKQLFES